MTSHMASLIRRRVHLNARADTRRLTSLGLNVAQMEAAVMKCRNVTAMRAGNHTPCVDKGHCCLACEVVGRSTS